MHTGKRPLPNDYAELIETPSRDACSYDGRGVDHVWAWFPSPSKSAPEHQRSCRRAAGRMPQPSELDPTPVPCRPLHTALGAGGKCGQHEPETITMYKRGHARRGLHDQRPANFATECRLPISGGGEQAMIAAARETFSRCSPRIHHSTLATAISGFATASLRMFKLRRMKRNSKDTFGFQLFK